MLTRALTSYTKKTVNQMAVWAWLATCLSQGWVPMQRRIDQVQRDRIVAASKRHIAVPVSLDMLLDHLLHLATGPKMLSQMDSRLLLNLR
jgi:hypothetical protein